LEAFRLRFQFPWSVVAWVLVVQCYWVPLVAREAVQRDNIWVLAQWMRKQQEYQVCLELSVVVWATRQGWQIHLRKCGPAPQVAPRLTRGKTSARAPRIYMVSLEMPWGCLQPEQATIVLAKGSHDGTIGQVHCVLSV